VALGGGSGPIALSTSQQQFSVLEFTGTLSGAVAVETSAGAAGHWIVLDSTAGGQTVTLRPTGGSGVDLPAGQYAQVFSDGTNIVETGSTSGGATIADGSVGSTKLATDAVIEVKIQDGAVTEDKIADLNVTALKLATDAVTTVKIKDDAIIGDKIAANTISGTKLSADLTLADVTLTGIATPSLNTSTTWNVSLKQTCSVTASGSTTVALTNFSGLAVGTPLTLIVADASGASLALSGPTFKHRDGTAPALNGTPNETMIVSMIVIASNTLAVTSVIVS
jgi:hypothetical protein